MICPTKDVILFGKSKWNEFQGLLITDCLNSV